MVGHEETRLERLHTIKESVKQAGKGLDVEKLINVCCLEWGCARRTILEYLKVLGIKEVQNDTI